MLISLHADLHEKVRWGEDTKANGKKGPSLHLASRVLIVHQLLADLAVNFIPVETWGECRNTDIQLHTRDSKIKRTSINSKHA